MKKITSLIILLISTSMIFGQTNLLVNGDFETGDLTGYGGFNNQNLIDDITNSNVGNGNNSEASIFQLVDVTPGETYDVTFDYRWVSGSGNYNLTVRVKEEETAGKPNIALTGATASDGFEFNQTPDQWFTNNTFSFTAPTGISKIRLLFYKANGNRPFRIDNLSLVAAPTASLEDLAKFNFKSSPNPVKDSLYLSAQNNIDDIEIYSILGQRVMQESLNRKNGELNIAHLSNGLYILKASIDDAVGTYKFIKQ